MRAAAVLLLAAVAACGGPSEPNVLLVTLDTTRADRLGAMGHAAARTPTLDALAARGVVFTRAFASASLTLPSHATILTGRDPDEHGIHDNGRFVLPPAATTVAETLAARGWDTAAFVAAFVLDASFGLDQGFAHYDDDVEGGRDPLRQDMPRRSATRVTDRALAWLGRARRAPFFLWVHYYDVHLPRRPPAPFDAMPDPYDGALAAVDAEMSRLLAGVERAAAGRETVIVIVGDHGEGLGEHGEETHGFLAYDTTLHVPLVIAGRAFPPGRSDAFARTIDIVPTLLAAAGVSVPSDLPGRSLADPPPVVEPVGYFEAFGSTYRLGWAQLRGVRTDRWKLTAEPAPIELYDTLADPGETANRAIEQPDEVARLTGILTARASANASGSPPAASPDIAEKLAALGYVDAAPITPSAASADPRRFVEALQLLDAVRSRAADGRVADGIRALQALAASPVVRPLALVYLAQLELVAGQPAAAVATAEALVAASGALESRLTLARALLDSGRAVDALGAIDAAHTAGLVSQRSHLARGAVLLELGRAEEAEREAAAVLTDAPRHDQALALASRARAVRDGAAAEIPRLAAIIRAAPEPTALLDARAMLATLLHVMGRDTDAVAVLLATEPQPADHRLLLADIAEAHGNPARAVELQASVVAERPGVAVHRRRLAELLTATGRLDEARAQYDALVEAAPNDAGLLVDRGATLAALANPDAAAADYRAALALDESLPEAHLNLALLELGQGDEVNAERHLQRAVALRPEYRKAHFHLARLYGRRGDPRAAAHGERAAGVEDSR